MGFPSTMTKKEKRGKKFEKEVLFFFFDRGGEERRNLRVSKGIFFKFKRKKRRTIGRVVIEAIEPKEKGRDDEQRWKGEQLFW